VECTEKWSFRSEKRRVVKSACIAVEGLGVSGGTPRLRFATLGVSGVREVHGHPDEAGDPGQRLRGKLGSD